MLKTKLDKNIIMLILGQIKEFWYAYLLGTFALTFTHLIQSYLPEYARELALLVGGEKGEISLKIFLLMAIGIIIFRSSSRLLFFWPARVMEKNLRVETLHWLENSPPARYKEYSKGQIFQVVNNDFEHVRGLVGFVLLQLINVFIALAVIIPRLASFNENLVICLTPLFLTFILFSFILSKRMSLFKKVQDSQGEVQNYIMESYQGKQTIKNYQAEKSFIKLFNKYCKEELTNFYKVEITISIVRPFMALGVGISLLWGAYVIRDQNLGASYLILFSGFVFLLTEPLMYVSWIGFIAIRASASWKRARELIKLVLTESDLEKWMVSRNINNDDELTTKTIVKFWDKSLQLEFVNNAWNVLVGKTGCGKTEVIFQIVHILKMKGKKVSLVAQSPYLYNDTVWANIFLGRTPTEKQIELARKYLTLLDLNFLSTNLNAIFDVEVGENGRNLSGGQAKRLAIVRSLMEEADFYVWDDPFAAIDMILEKKIIKELFNDENLKEKTFIISSHRVSTVKFCDQLIHLDRLEGIYETGQVNNLLETESKTYELFKNQLV